MFDKVKEVADLLLKITDSKEEFCCRLMPVLKVAMSLNDARNNFAEICNKFSTERDKHFSTITEIVNGCPHVTTFEISRGNDSPADIVCKICFTTLEKPKNENSSCFQHAPAQQSTGLPVPVG